jgi:DNA primase large subunit
MLTSKNDLAKYPFTHEARRYIEGLHIKVEELATEEYSPILDKAERRIEESILYGCVDHQWTNSDVEILSFPVSIMLIMAIRDNFLNRRCALGEARRAYNLLRSDQKERILDVSFGTFNWDLRSTIDSLSGQTFDFTLDLRSFLRNSIAFQDRKWKLVNRVMMNGNIYLTREEAGRLLQEEVQRQVQERLSQPMRLELAGTLEQRTSRLRELLDRRKKTVKSYEMPTEIVIGAFPSCIKVLHDSASSGRHLSHMGRFALASFLLNVGSPAEKIIELFTEASDFDERMTKYQVEHIAGMRGAGTKYSSPNCSTLKTHGLCRNPDEICKAIRHPLSYYRRKLSMTRRISEQ